MAVEAAAAIIFHKPFLRAQTLDELLLCILRMVLRFLHKIKKKRVEALRVTVDTEDAVSVDVVFLPFEEYLRLLDKVHDTVLLLTVGVRITHVIICEILLQLTRQPLLKLLNKVHPPILDLDLWHPQYSLVCHIWMQLGVVTEVPDRRDILSGDVDTQEQVKHALLRWISHHVVEVALDANDHLTNLLFLAHTRVMRDGATILHRDRVTHLVIHFEHEVEKLRLHLYLGIFKDTELCQLPQHHLVPNKLLCKVRSI